jgi:hypothetical protein
LNFTPLRSFQSLVIHFKFIDPIAPKMTTALHSRIIGTYFLISYSYYPTTSPSQKSYPLGPHATGTIMYHPSGHMSAVLVRPGQPAFSDGGGLSPETSGTAADWETVGRNVTAYSGRFWVKDEDTVMHELGVCFLSRFSGAVQERKVEFGEGGREMVLSVDGVNIGGVDCRIEVQWKRMEDNNIRAAVPDTQSYTTK